MNHHELEKYIIRKSLIIAAVFALIGVGFQIYTGKNFSSVIFGWLWGCAVQFIAFRILCRSVEKSVNFMPQHAYAYAHANYMFRMLIYGVALIAGFKLLKLNMIAMGAGLLVVRIAILFETFRGVLHNNSKCVTNDVNTEAGMEK